MRFQSVAREFLLLLGVVAAAGETALSFLPDGKVKAIAQLVLPLIAMIVARAQTTFVPKGAKAKGSGGLVADLAKLEAVVAELEPVVESVLGTVHGSGTDQAAVDSAAAKVQAAIEKLKSLAPAPAPAPAPVPAPAPAPAPAPPVA